VRRVKYLTLNSYLFSDCKPGDVWLAGDVGSRTMYAFLYADDKLTIRYFGSNREFQSNISFSSRKTIKLSFKVDELKEKLDMCKCKEIYRQIYYTFERNSGCLEITGASLQLYDYVISYTSSYSEFNREVGLLIGENKILCADGSKKLVHICKKCTEEDLVSMQSKISVIQTMFMSRQRQELKLSNANTVYNLGDIYKKGDNVYIYLGKRKIRTQIKDTCKVISEIATPEIYSIGGDLWLYAKLSNTYMLRKLVLGLLQGELDGNIGESKAYLVCQANVCGIKVEQGNYGCAVKSYNCFKYNVKPSVLGGYIGNLKLTDNLFKHTFYMHYSHYPREVQEVAKSLLITLE
jgi:hypothetical protein